MEQSFEELLRAKLSEPVRKKGTQETLLNADGSVMKPMDAMVMSVVNEAMKGSIPHLTFIRNATRDTATDQETRERNAQRAAQLGEKIKKELEADGLYLGQDTEIEMLAQNAMLLEIMNEATQQPDFQPVIVEIMRDGNQKMTPNPLITMRDNQQKKVMQDLKALRQDATVRKSNRKIFNR